MIYNCWQVLMVYNDLRYTKIYKRVYMVYNSLQGFNSFRDQGIQ